MPHTPECKAAAPEGYCIGGCSVTPEDYPTLAAILDSSGWPPIAADEPEGTVLFAWDEFREGLSLDDSEVIRDCLVDRLMDTVIDHGWLRDNLMVTARHEIHPMYPARRRYVLEARREDPPE